MVCKLKKAIYGIKQSPQAGFDKFSRIFSEVELQKYYSDHSVFIHRTSSDTMILVVYVNDIPLTGSDVGIMKAKEYMRA